jgi:hypothetical protein
MGKQRYRCGDATCPWCEASMTRWRRSAPTVDEGLAEHEPDCAEAMPRIEVTPEQAEWIAERIADPPPPSRRLINAVKKLRGGR